MDIKALRNQFPALRRHDHGQPVIWADAPGGTQVPNCVIDGMSRFLRRGTANVHGDFAASAETDAIVEEARKAAAIFFGCSNPEEIHFGQNTTSLHFSLSHALAQTWNAGDAIIITNLDHDANVRPWVLAAEQRGIEIREWSVRIEDACLHLSDLEKILDTSVKFIAVTAAANALGSICNIKKISELCHAQGAVVAVDAVHLAPHRLIDVGECDCDIITVSAYKFFGPHIGLQWIRESLRRSLPALKVIPAPDSGAGKFETGTQNFEALAGFYECIAYIGQISGSSHLSRKAIIEAFKEIRTHEDMLSHLFLRESTDIPGLKIIGHGSKEINLRTPTFGCIHDELPAHILSRELAKHGIYTWAGHFYSIGLTKALGLDERGGLLRIGFAHYHCSDEVRRICRCLREIIVSLS